MKFSLKNISLSFLNFFKNKQYSQNWSKPFIKNVQTLKLRNLSLVLEIGCFEGQTSNYIVTQILEKDRGKLICVDPLSDEYLGSNLLKKKTSLFLQTI